MQKLVLVFLMITSSIVRAENTAVTDALETKIVKHKIVATLKPGFHFNDKAPSAVVVDGKRSEPAVLSRQKVVFQLPSSYAVGAASLFICDDAVTFCEPRTVEFRGGADANDYMVARAEMKRAQSKDKKKKAQINKHGFLEDNLDRAAELAAKNKSLILADFSARWCPGCIRLEGEIFGTSAFKKASKSFVKVKLDYDRFENLPLKEKFGIFGIPTLLVLTSDLREVSRLVDYQPLSSVEQFLGDAKKTPTPLDELKVAAEKEPAANLALAQRLYNANRFADSLPYFEKAKPEPIEYLDAKVRAAQKAYEASPSKKSAYIDTVHEALTKEPNSSRSIVWRTGLVSALSSATEKQTIVTEGTKVADDLLAHPDKIMNAMKGDLVGEFANYEKLLLAIERADLIEASGATEADIQDARELVTKIGRALKIPTSKKGPSVRLLVVMGEAKEYKDAEQLARKLLKLEPRNPELQRRLLRTLNGQEKFAEAVAVGRKAISNSYGKNEILVAIQLAKAYVGNKQGLEAKSLARSYLDRSDIDWKLMPNEQKDLQAIVQANL